MRKLWPNFDQEDGLDIVLEVPIPDEMFKKMGDKAIQRWKSTIALKKSHSVTKSFSTSSAPNPNSGRNAELQLLLNVIGSTLLPLQAPTDHAMNRPIRDTSIEASTAKYIVQQYVAAMGGPAALNAIRSMYAIGQVKMSASEFHVGEENVRPKDHGEIGGFVLWLKNPDLWSLELVVSGCKLSAGSNGRVTWRQFAHQQSHASRGPPRPLRRFYQGLDPMATANLFADAIQRSGLLLQLEDTNLLRISKGEDSVFWETSMESVIKDYKYIEGVNIAHGGKTTVTLFRYGEGSFNHKRKMEELWTIEEVDFNLRFRKYQAVFEFSQACGICAGTLIRIRGVIVGSVIRMKPTLKSIEVVVEVSRQLYLNLLADWL
ncbi:hypothetical protein Scep_004713 [Stephania cephalantha]|uniref:Mce/MlaD domain-containing protein n=1 Tax=Stephania cephalantha TaxID=152367 RepID=A0AAP0PXJ4_9MAGN